MFGTMMLVLLANQPAPVPTPTPTPTPPAIVRLQTRTPAPAPAASGSSLSDVAATITLRRPAGDEPRLITNDVLREVARGVELTVGAPSAAPSQTSPEWEDRDRSEAALRERWQGRYRQALGRIQQLETQIRRLESDVGRLERNYYAEDNPHYRDGVIKPAWDKALVELRSSRIELVEARKEPEIILNQARREGALPGWFRGLEPAAPPLPSESSR